MRGGPSHTAREEVFTEANMPWQPPSAARVCDRSTGAGADAGIDARSARLPRTPASLRALWSRYLGLMENLRVARAGYCYRRPFAYFLQRYKSLCPATWPQWTGDPKDGVKVLTDYLKLPEGEVAIGNTKVFVLNPRTVTTIEKAFQDRKPALATKIAARFKGFRQRKIYLRLKAAAVATEKYARMRLVKIHSAARTAQKHARIVLSTIAMREREKGVRALGADGLGGDGSWAGVAARVGMHQPFSPAPRPDTTMPVGCGAASAN